MAMVPIWFPIKDWPNYEVSDTDLIRNKTTKHVLKQVLDKGYLMVCLRNNGKQLNQRVHRIIAIARLPNPENKREVNHKNGIKTDNLPDNFEWVTRQENARHALDTGLMNMDHLEDYLTRRREQTHCKYGHLIDGINPGGRHCKTCARRKQAAYIARKKARTQGS